MRHVKRLLLLALVAAVAAPASAAGPVANLHEELVDLSVRPFWVSVAGAPVVGFAAAYDDRFYGNGLRFAERGRNGEWSTEVVATEIEGRRVGREPSLAVSPTGLRVIAFRTDIRLTDDIGPNGVLYAARSHANGAWVIDRIDSAGFGAQSAFDHEGRPAVAYLVRTGTDDGAEVRIALRRDGAWQVQTLARTAFRRSKANTTRVGLAFDTEDRPWAAYVDARSGSLRLATPTEPSRRVGSVPTSAAQASLALAANGAAAIAVSGLAGQSGELWVAHRRHEGGAFKVRRIGGTDATAATIVGFRQRRPIVAFLDREGIRVATPSGGAYRVSLVYGARYGAGTTYNGSLGAAVRRGSLGVALVAPRGLLTFTAGRVAR
jgi:hypothetical protein